MNRRSLSWINAKSLVLCLLLSTPLLYFIVQNNFLIDDWAQLSYGNTLEEQINSWRSLWSYRPVSWVLIPSILHLFNDNFVLIAVLHLALYLFSIFQILNWKKLCLSQTQKRIAAILILSPVFASSFMLSPVNQLSASLSLAFFAFALHVEKYKINSRLVMALTYSLFLLSVLSYEISIPLIFMHYLFSLRNNYRFSGNFMTFPMLLVFLFSWQKLIAPNFFGSDFSRFGSFSLLSLVSFVFSYLVAIPQFIVVKTIGSTLAVLCLVGVLLFVTRSPSNNPRDFIKHRFVELIVLVGFLSNGALFLFSGRFSQITGYGNRGQTSSWIIFSILIVILLGSKKNIKFYFLLFFSAANYLLFWDKSVESSSASQLRTKIISQLVVSPMVGYERPSTLILKLPCILPNSKFRTEIFCTAWDARGALKFNGLEIANVFLVSDPDFPRYFQKINPEDKLIIIDFTSNFQIVKIQKIDLKIAADALAPYSAKWLEQDSQIEECIKRAKEFLELRVSGEFRSYLDCVKPLMQPNK